MIQRHAPWDLVIDKLLRNPFGIACGVTIIVWLAFWLAAMPNLYGWLLDDSDTFYRALKYESGGFNYYDIPWFHAYMWFLMFPPWQLHWAIPSYSAPRSWEATPQFRALILYTIVLHGIVLGMVAYLIRQLSARAWVAFAAFLLVLTSPTLALYTPSLDSRYLGLLGALPAMILLLRANKLLESGHRVPNPFVYYVLPGVLFGVGEDIHYECLYLIVPFSLTYWLLRVLPATRSARDRPRFVRSLYGIASWMLPVGLSHLLTRRLRSRPITREWRPLAFFILGLALWIVPVEMLSLLFHPFERSYIGTLLFQYSQQIPPYTRSENLATWFHIYTSEMGLPMMIAVAAGALMVASGRYRPPYISETNARLMVWCGVIFACYVAVSPTYPFYRMSFGLQIFYAVLAVALIDRVVDRAFSSHRLMRRAGRVLLVLCVAFVPSLLRTPEVYAAQQGYGRAINLANQLGGSAKVHYISTFDTDARPEQVISREQFAALPLSDYLVTYFPETFHFKYPDLFALLYDTVPVASFPTLWCTAEMWSQVPTFFGGRRWSEEPPNCNAYVYRVSDLRRAESGPRLQITSITADSTFLPRLGPRRALALRQPSLRWYGAELWDVYWDLWVSAPTSGEHWLEIRFAKPTRLDAITVVPPEFRVPPDFLWRGRKRNENMEVDGGVEHGPLHRLWEEGGLQNRVIVDVRFPPTILSWVRFRLWQGKGSNPAVGIKFIRFPGFRQTTRWANADVPGHPPPSLVTPYR